jgi:hypothetical protein
MGIPTDAGRGALRRPSEPGVKREERERREERREEECDASVGPPGHDHLMLSTTIDLRFTQVLVDCGR